MRLNLRPWFVCKIVLIILATPVVLTVLLLVGLSVFFSAVNGTGGFDVVGGKPERAFQKYVQEAIPSGVKVLGAEGRGFPPHGGIWVLFRLQLDEKSLNELITSKHLEQVETINPRAFGTNNLTHWKKPEFYLGRIAPPYNSSSTTWTTSFAVDRETGVALYRTGGD